MHRTISRALHTTLTAAVLLAGTSCPIPAETLQLPAPQTEAGRPLMQALKDRATNREISARSLDAQALSNLLWAAFGVNRPETGGRTAPSAWDHQEIDLYVFTSDAVYLYEPAGHSLKTVLEGDHRDWTGSDEFSKQAPVTLVYVADHSRSPKTRVETKPFYAAIVTGSIGQNVYLYCASAGLATVIHDGADKRALGKGLEMRADQQIILAQAVGYPK